MMLELNFNFDKWYNLVDTEVMLGILLNLTRLRKEIPNISIRTSLIVGFPGETEEQFEELKGFLKSYPLENVGIFYFPLKISFLYPNFGVIWVCLLRMLYLFFS